MLTEWLQAGIEVVPAVDVLGVGAVRLQQGNYDDVVERAGDPVSLARRWATAGATRIHVVDLDGARSGAIRPALVGEIVNAAAPAAVQASGGIRSLADAHALLAAGVIRVLCTAIDRDGTLAGPDLDLVERVAASGLRVLAAGGVRSPEDVGALAHAGAEAAVVGRALLKE